MTDDNHDRVQLLDRLIELPLPFFERLVFLSRIEAAIPGATASRIERAIAVILHFESSKNLGSLALHVSALEKEHRASPAPTAVFSWTTYADNLRRNLAANSPLSVPIDARVDPTVTHWQPPVTFRGAQMTTEAVPSKPSAPRPLRELLRQEPRLVILGEPGSGKTTALHMAALELVSSAAHSEEPGPVPVILDLADYRMGGPHSGPSSLIEFARSQVATTLGIRVDEVPLTDIMHRFRVGGLVLMLDGFNEVPSALRQRCAAEIQSLVSTYGMARIYVTTRKYGYVGQLDLPAVDLLDFDARRIEDLVRRFTNDEVTSSTLINRLSPDQRRMAQNPLMLRVLIEIFLANGDLPANRTTLLQRYVDSLFSHEAARRSRAGEPLVDRARVMDVLARLAVHMTTTTLTIVPGDALRVLDSGQPAQGNMDMIGAALAIGLLCEANGRLRFSHQSVQEFFCVLRLSEIWLTDRPTITKFFKTPRFWETLSMVGSLLSIKDREDFFEHCERTDPYLAAMAMNNAGQGDSPRARALVDDTVRLSRWVRLLMSLLVWRNLAILACMINLLDGLTFRYGSGIEIFHVIHKHVVLPSWLLPYRVSASVINLSCLLVITIAISALVTSTVYHGFQLRLFALQHLRTPHARDALIQIHTACLGNRYLHPGYHAMVERSFLASTAQQTELLQNLRVGHYVPYSLACLSSFDSSEAAAALSAYACGPPERIETLAALYALRTLHARTSGPEREALAAAAERVLRSRAPLEYRRLAREILVSDLGMSAPRPRLFGADVARAALPEVVAVIIVVCLTFLFYSRKAVPVPSDAAIHPTVLIIVIPCYVAVVFFAWLADRRVRSFLDLAFWRRHPICELMRLHAFGGTGEAPVLRETSGAERARYDQRTLFPISFLFGILGIDRFLLGYRAIALMKLITLGGFGLWWALDIILVALGAIRDANGRYVRNAFAFGTPRKSQSIAFLLAVMAGLFGADRFYLGHWATGLLKALTLGGAGVLYVSDIFVIGMGTMTDSMGSSLKYEDWDLTTNPQGG